MMGTQPVRRKYRKSGTIAPPCADLSLKLEQCMSTLGHDLLGCVHLITGFADLIAEEANGRLEPRQLEWLNFIKAGSRGVQDAVERGQASFHALVHAERIRK
jgi:light-regulated signal transduction histidine kinase (bacteriophytochrome)